MKAELTFPDTKSLWAFQATLDALPLEVNTVNATLLCHCNYDQLLVARQVYGATEVKVPRSTDHKQQNLFEILSHLLVGMQAKIFGKPHRFAVAKDIMAKNYVNRLYAFVGAITNNVVKHTSN